LEPSEEVGGTAPHSNQQCTIEVAGLPDGATEDLVSVNPELQTSQVTFESPDGTFN